MGIYHGVKCIHKLALHLQNVSFLNVYTYAVTFIENSYQRYSFKAIININAAYLSNFIAFINASINISCAYNCIIDARAVANKTKTACTNKHISTIILKRDKMSKNKRPKGPHIVHLSTICHLFEKSAKADIFVN